METQVERLELSDTVEDGITYLRLKGEAENHGTGVKIMEYYEQNIDSKNVVVDFSEYDDMMYADILDTMVGIYKMQEKDDGKFGLLVPDEKEFLHKTLLLTSMGHAFEILYDKEQVLEYFTKTQDETR